MLQLVLYGVVGVVNNAIVYCIYLLISFYGLEPKMAMTLAYIIGVFTAFFFNRKLTFANSCKTTYVVLPYLLAHLFGYLLNYLILFIFVDNLGYPHQWVQAIAITIVAIFLFIIFKYFVFTQRL